jgi:Nucleotidyl transferase AbiEii toxin, Type IV TA system
MGPSLHLENLPEAMRRVFLALAQEPLLADFTLIGGTALALQIGHRQSEDLDFALTAKRLPKLALARVLANARAAGFAVQDMLSPTQIAQTRINFAADLRDWVQDWSIDGVKVSFSTFEGFGAQMQALLAYPRVNWEMPPKRPSNGNLQGFTVLGVEGLFAAKACLLARRQRSRDLFDLYTLIGRCGYSVRQLFDVIGRIDPTANPDHHRDVLRGLIPLDAADEGFASIGLERTVEEIYAFFEEKISAYEQEEAARILAALP